MLIQSISIIFFALVAAIHGLEDSTIPTKEQAIEGIQNHVRSYQSNSISAIDIEKCTISATEPCSMASMNMARDGMYFIYPGGKTRCITSTSTPFAFEVIPGDKDKLLVFFQGGGVCWNELTTDSGIFCNLDANPQPLVGIFDRIRDDNAYKNFTIIHISYCSGDLHAGNVTRSYNDKAGKPVVQVGLYNTQSAIDWIKEQIQHGYLASKFSSFVVMGASAGAAGSQLWSKGLLEAFQWEHAAVVPDSLAGYLPKGVAGPLIEEFGYCTAEFLSEKTRSRCKSKQLEFPDIAYESMGLFPQVPFVYLQSKTDEVQLFFYNVFGLTMTPGIIKKTATPAQFYEGVNEVFSNFNANHKNFITYLVNGYWHCFTYGDYYYTTDPISSKDDGQSTGNMKLYQWMNPLPLSANESIDSKCDGTLKASSSSIPADTTYCSKNVVPKTYVQE